MNRSLALCLFAAACSNPADVDPTEIRSELPRNMNPAVTQAELATLVAGNTAFATDLYRQVRTEPGNLFMSPHSISTALAMTYAGAAGTTASQMASTLHFTLPPTQLHAALSKLDLELAARATAATGSAIPFRLTTANSIWGQQGKAFQAPFLDTLAVNYGAGLHVLDFAADPDGSREVINTWVEDRTNDRIKDLLPEGSINDGTRLVLANAIYFSAAWDDPFEASQTADRPFRLASGTSVAVPSLRQNAQYRYGVGDGFRSAELPYDGGQLAMVVVVPDDLASFEAGLDPAILDQVTGSLQTHLLDLTLPKFRFDAPLSLTSTLQALGMTDAFGAADFSGIDGTRDLVITDVLHKGFVAIDEKGTEAAAATAVVIGETSIPEPATLVVDRPFLFFIRDVPTGAILFIGRVVDPR
ncbi:MAG: serpin family protein [Myxococcota bacterium]|nr:serpin family protein [Myxococcota bacterium]